MVNKPWPEGLRSWRKFRFRSSPTCFPYNHDLTLWCWTEMWLSGYQKYAHHTNLAKNWEDKSAHNLLFNVYGIFEAINQESFLSTQPAPPKKKRSFHCVFATPQPPHLLRFLCHSHLPGSHEDVGSSRAPEAAPDTTAICSRQWPSTTAHNDASA